jgi:hypothetical protein
MIGAMNDWDQFVEDVTWFLAPGDCADLGETEQWPRGAVAGLPELSDLLARASITPVSVNGRGYELLAWGPADARRGWLCLPPTSDPIAAIHPIHQHFQAVCGGIIERFGEPVSWWNNQNEILTDSAAHVSLSAVFADYAWIWHDEGLEVPIEPDDYYAVAVEANGNLTLAHRADGQLLVFAPDHDFEGVTPLPGSPPYSLMTIDEAPDLAAWIELGAKAWAEVTRKDRPL